MIGLLYLAALITLFYLAYILSLFSSAAYFDIENLEDFLSHQTGFRRKYLALITERPRITFQVAVLFKSFALVAASFLGLLLAQCTATEKTISFEIICLITLALIWILYLLIVEFLPRQKVLRASSAELIQLVPIFAAAYILLTPIIWVYGRLFPAEKRQKISDGDKEDIIERAIESLAEQAGVDEPLVEEDEKEMIGQIFQLDVTEVREVMVPRIRIIAIEKTAPFEEIRRITKEYGFSRYPIFEGNIDNIKGILYVKDLFTDASPEPPNFNIADWMRSPHFVPETKIISDLLKEFKSTKVHIAIAVDEYGGTAGLITLEDILEEIVGEIQDEHDFEKAPLTRLPDGSYRVDASMMVEDLVEDLGLDYDIEEFETVGGLIYDLVGSVPSEGARLRWKDFIFEIEKVEGTRIKVLKAWVKKGTEY